jgi:hypothetical protein
MSEIGRWNGVDVLAEKTMEIYSYVENNPIINIDPDGMSFERVNPKDDDFKSDAEKAKDSINKTGSHIIDSNDKDDKKKKQDAENKRKPAFKDDYDYSKETIDGKWEADIDYIWNGEDGNLVSRLFKTIVRDFTAEENQETVKDVSISVTLKLAKIPGGGLINKARKGGGQGKGERNRTGKETGTDNPWKHWRTDPKNPKQIVGKDANGNTKYKPKPSDFPKDK